MYVGGRYALTTERPIPAADLLEHHHGVVADALTLHGDNGFGDAMDHFRLLLGRKHILDDLDIDVRHGLFLPGCRDFACRRVTVVGHRVTKRLRVSAPIAEWSMSLEVRFAGRHTPRHTPSRDRRHITQPTEEWVRR